MGLEINLHRMILSTTQTAKEGIAQRVAQDGAEKVLKNVAKPVVLNSTQHPEHLFRVGYFRSSDTAQGINNILRSKNVADLYGIFRPEGQCQTVKALFDLSCGQAVFCNWSDALARTQSAIAHYDEHCRAQEPEVCLQTVRVTDLEQEGAPDSEFAAQALFLRRRAQRPEASEPKVLGVIPGTTPGPDGQPVSCFFVVQEVVYDAASDWYAQALQIVEETIKYVLAQPQSEQFFLAWSELLD